MNEIPQRPDIACPVPTPPYPTYNTDLQSNLNVSRKDKFLLIMDIPDMLKPFLREDVEGCNNIALDRLQMNIWGHVIPEIQKPKLDVKWGGQSMKVSSFSTQVYPTITVNYTVDNRFDNYFILYSWMNLINDQEKSTFDARNMGRSNQSGTLKDYTTTITVYALDEYDKPTLEFIYNSAFPTALGGVNASQRDANEFESTFSFDFSNLSVKRSREFLTIHPPNEL